MSSPVYNNPVTSVRMQTALTAKPQTYADLVRISGLKQPAVTRWVKVLRGARVVFIASWGPDKNGRLVVPEFSCGPGPDAKRPGCVASAAQRMRNTRARRKLAAESGVGPEDLL